MRFLTLSRGLWVIASFSCLARAQTSTVNSRAEYMGTAVQTNPNGIPTLSYNCAKTPALCNNVHGNGGNYQLNTVLNHSGQDSGWKGTLANVAFLELNVDRGSAAAARILTRRAESCPHNWKAIHPCPELGGGQSVVVLPGKTVSDGVVGQRLNPQLPPAAGHSYDIAGPNGIPLDLTWSCDEFPPAFSVEGGFRQDLNRAANTYCAPVACPGGRANEQNLQGIAPDTFNRPDILARGIDSVVKGQCNPPGTPDGIFTIHFTTAFRNDDWEFSTRVEFYLEGAPDAFQENYKRGVEYTVTLARRSFYENGTIIELRRQVPRDHGQPQFRRRDLALDAFEAPLSFGQRITITTLRSAVAQETAPPTNGPFNIRQEGGCSGAEDPPEPEYDVAMPIGSIQDYSGASAGTTVQGGRRLRILTIGDSITVGFLSNQNGGNGDGYHRRLRDNLGNEVVFAGTETMGTMENNYYAAWSGRTIRYMADHVGPSLEQRPNLVLLMAGTNDMHPDPDVSTEGNDPFEASSRLGALIDQIFEACPDATVLVAIIVPTCVENKIVLTQNFQAVIPLEVLRRQEEGRHIMTVNLAAYPVELMRDCVHPTNEGYSILGDWWYDFITQIPDGWIQEPIGPDPERTENQNGGPNPDIPPPNWGRNPIQPTSRDEVASAAERAEEGGRSSCNSLPRWEYTGQIGLGLSRSGDFQYHRGWVEKGQLAEGIHRTNAYVRLVDMNADGKADYVWLDPETGMTICWLNNLPEPWSRAGTNDSIIASGAGRADSVFLADMNGDGYADYMVVNPNNGEVQIWWNYGPDDDWANGWRFVPGGVIATGVPHANWDTLRFPDINGDGRGDYVTVGVGGSLALWLNMGHAGAQDPIFHEQGGIATGAVNDISRLVFADMDGDGRDDYLIWDEDAGLTGFLNKATFNEGVPIYINQGPAKTIAEGINQLSSSIRLADMNGDGKDDYVLIGDEGGLWVWENQGDVDTSMTIDGVRFADIDGDGLDDYVWLHPETGAPTVYINGGVTSDDSLGWLWNPLNDGDPIASGVTLAENVQFGDIDGDGMDDYLVLHPETGELRVWINKGPAPERPEGWSWEGIGSIASGLGPSRNIRFADIDGDGRDDYIYLRPNGGTTIYRNVFEGENHFTAMPEADASGIGRAPDEIHFVDINGDGKADYVWLNPLDGSSTVWFNNYPNTPTWLEQPEVAGGVGVSGRSVRYGHLQATGRASYIAMDPDTGAISAWLNGCSDRGPPPELNRNPCVSVRGIFTYNPLLIVHGDSLRIEFYEDGRSVCNASASKTLASDETEWELGCGDEISSRGSRDDSMHGDGWHYENTDGPVVRNLRLIQDDRWTEECGGTETRPIRCGYETFHGKDRCGMNLPPLDTPVGLRNHSSKRDVSFF